MLRKSITKITDSVKGFRARHAQDDFLLRWVVVSVLTLALAVGMQACRFILLLDEIQLRLLAGHPFYLSAEDAQVSLLSPVASFSLCVVITLYLSAILMRRRSLVSRSHIALLAAVAVALPGIIGILWHGVLYVGQMLLCIFFLWLLLVPVSFIYRRFRS